MKTEQYLSQIERLKVMIENKVEEVNQLENMACGISSPSSDGDRIDVSLDPDKIGRAICKIEDKRNAIDKMIGDYLDKYDLIVEQIDGMDNIDSYSILTMRFVQNKKFAEIEDKHHWSRSKCNRVYNSALYEFEKKYGETYMKKTR